MKAIMAALLLVLGLLVTPGTASDPLRRVFPAPVERVWTATLTALATQGWGLDDAARTTVAVERDVFRRERVFWVERDERIDVVDPARVEGELERSLLSAIPRAL